MRPSGAHIVDNPDLVGLSWLRIELSLSEAMANRVSVKSEEMSNTDEKWTRRSLKSQWE